MLTVCESLLYKIYRFRFSFVVFCTRASVCTWILCLFLFVCSFSALKFALVYWSVCSYRILILFLALMFGLIYWFVASAF